MLRNHTLLYEERHYAIEKAFREFYAILDSDDWLTTDKLHICFDYIHDKVDFVYHDLKIIRDPPSLFISKFIKSR